MAFPLILVVLCRIMLFLSSKFGGWGNIKSNTLRNLYAKLLILGGAVRMKRWMEHKLYPLDPVEKPLSLLLYEIGALVSTGLSKPRCAVTVEGNHWGGWNHHNDRKRWENANCFARFRAM